MRPGLSAHSDAAHWLPPITRELGLLVIRPLIGRGAHLPSGGDLDAIVESLERIQAHCLARAPGSVVLLRRPSTGTRIHI